jgi:hypothetical protein
MSAGNDTVGEMWQETKIFEGTDTLEQVMSWVKTRNRNVILTVPAGEDFPDIKVSPIEDLIR